MKLVSQETATPTRAANRSSVMSHKCAKRPLFQAKYNIPRHDVVVIHITSNEAKPYQFHTIQSSRAFHQWLSDWRAAVRQYTLTTNDQSTCGLIQ